jgi:hypothetical protein
MRLHIESVDAEFVGILGVETACATLPLAIDSGWSPHAEDVFLADFVRVARARGHAEFAALELARAALDAVEDIDGVWQGLGIEAWLDAAARMSLVTGDGELVLLARAFVTWLVDRGRLSLHGQRLLVRRIARFGRRCGESVTPAPLARSMAA